MPHLSQAIYRNGHQQDADPNNHDGGEVIPKPHHAPVVGFHHRCKPTKTNPPNALSKIPARTKFGMYQRPRPVAGSIASCSISETLPTVCFGAGKCIGRRLMAGPTHFRGYTFMIDHPLRNEGATRNQSNRHW
jgi:hypothetical protein